MPQFVSFNQFRDELHGAKFGAEVDRQFAQLEGAPAGAAALLGPSASRSARREALATELDKMLDYLRRYYHPEGTAGHTFLDPGGNFVDCLPFDQLASVRSVRKAGGEVTDEGPRLSGFEARPHKRGFDRPPTPGHVVPFLRRGLVDRFNRRLACPDGHVAVARLTADDMARAGSFDQFFSKVKLGAAPKKKGGKPPAKAKKPAKGKGVPPMAAAAKVLFPMVGGHSYANTNDGPVGVGRGPYFGCSTGLGIRQPQVPMNTASISQLWLIGETMGNGMPQTVESGWMVQPGLFNTTSPVLFVFYNPDGYGPASGYVTNPDNLKGFVPAPDAPFVIGQHGFLIPPAAGGGPTALQVYWEFFDTPDPGWYFYCGHVGQTPADYTYMGYFPAHLYAGTMLQSQCRFAQFGGEVGGLTSVPAGTPPGFIDMGSGSPPTADATFNYNNVAFQCDVKVQQTQNAHMVAAALSPLQVDTADGFSLNFPTDPAYATYFFFGGRRGV